MKGIVDKADYTGIMAVVRSMVGYITFIPSWIWAALFVVVWFLVLNLLKRRVLRKLRQVAKQTETKWDDVLLRIASFPLSVLIFVIGIYLADLLFGFGTHSQRYTGAITLFGIVTAIAYFIDRFVTGLIRKYEAKGERFKSYSGIVKTVAHIVIYALGLMIVLDSLGISITPLIASLGVGSIAIALALQDTLANLFSGLYVLVDQPISVGQYIKLDSGEEGFVENIGWRSTRLRKLPNNVVIVPNSKISNSTITNYYLPVAELSAVVPVGVHYDSDLEHVEKVTVEVARQVMREVEGGVPDFDPFIRYSQFGESSINFNVILRARDFVGRFLVIHEFIKRLHKRYKQEGIVIPFPIRTIYLEEAEGKDKKANQERT